MNMIFMLYTEKQKISSDYNSIANTVWHKFFVDQDFHGLTGYK